LSCGISRRGDEVPVGELFEMLKGRLRRLEVVCT
jgi:hypothetical protein